MKIVSFYEKNQKEENRQVPESIPHLLIVEDSAIQAQMLKRILEKAGYAVAVAKNGVEGLIMAKESLPALIISDIVMPEMDGFDLCKQIKADPLLKEVAVVLLTSLTGLIDIFKGLSCGADDFITKPYEEVYLLSNIRRTLDARQFRKGEEGRPKETVDITVAGAKYRIEASRNQIIDFLLSAYETAVHKNKELINAEEKLKTLNESLEKQVEERTEALNQKINEHKLAAEALQISETQWETTFDAMSDWICVIDPVTRKILRSNQAGEGLLNLTREEITGQTCCRLFHELDAPAPDCPLTKMVHTEKRETIEMKLDKMNKWFQITVDPVKNDKNEITGAVHIVRDITENKRFEERQRLTAIILHALNRQDTWHSLIVQVQRITIIS
ncbi:MAG: response regulator [Desulfobacteraceae bacterium]|nr:MAG: response regulator [Desulfobacteraceae bacterium]